MRTLPDHALIMKWWAAGRMTLQFLPGLLFLLAVLTPVFAQQTGPDLDEDLQGRLVEEVELLVDRPLSGIAASDLYSLVTLREGDVYSLAAVRNSIQRLYSTGRFFDIRVGAEPTAQNGVRVTFRLGLRVTVRRIEFKGRVSLNQDSLRRVATLRAGQAFRQEALAQTMEQLQAFYQDSGYYQASLDSRIDADDAESSVVVIIQVDSGQRARIADLTLHLEGNASRGEILSRLNLRQGGKFSEIEKEQRLEALQEYLVQQGYFAARVWSEPVVYDPRANSVSVEVGIDAGTHTEIRFMGPRPPDKVLFATPLYTEANPSPVFLDETVDQLTEHLQLQGSVFASVSYERSDEAPYPASVVFRLENLERYEVRNILFRGNEDLDSARLARELEVKGRGVFDKGRFSGKAATDDLKRLEGIYQDVGYLDVEAAYSLETTEQGRVNVVYRVQEGPQYMVDRLDIRGLRHFTREEVLPRLANTPGLPFSPLAIAQDRITVATLYEDEGYRNVDIRSEVEFLPENRIGLVYTVEEGQQFFVDEVIVSGNKTTRDSVIRKQLAIQPGQPASFDRILKTETNLYNLAVFRRVQINEAPSFRDPLYRTILIDLEEARRFTLVYGAGYSTFEGPRVTFGINDSNLQGKARASSLNLRVSKVRQRAALSYTFPRLLEGRLPTVLGLTVNNEKAQTETTIGDTQAFRGKPFDSFRVIASAQAERILSRRESLFMRYEFEEVNTQVPEGFDPELEYFRQEEHVRLSSLALSYLNESRTDPRDPSGGFLLSGDTKFSTKWLGSGEDLWRIFANTQYYQPLGRGVIWVASMRLGIVTPFGQSEEVPISERYFSGGATTHRGVPQDLLGPLLEDEDGIVLVNSRGEKDENGNPVPLGGEGVALLNTELRFPIYRFVRGSVFYDLGTVFDTLDSIARSRFENAMGFGVHLRTPVGPIRFDVGYNPNPRDAPTFNHWNFYLTLGHPF